MWPPHLDLRNQMKRTPLYRRKSSIKNIIPLYSPNNPTTLSSRRRARPKSARPKKMASPYQKPYPEYKTNKRARPKSARAPRNPKHHLITSNLNLDISLPVDLELFIQEQKEERVATKNKINRLDFKTKKLLDLETRELNIARSLQPSVQQLDDSSTPNDIITHASRRMCSPNKDKRLTDTWKDVTNDLDHEKELMRQKITKARKKKYHMCKKKQDKDFQIQMNGVVYRHEVKSRQKELNRKRVPKPVRKTRLLPVRQNKELMKYKIKSVQTYGKFKR